MISTDAGINLSFTCRRPNILYANENLKDFETIVNNELQNRYNWLTANKLTLNIKRSNFVIFHPYQKRLAY